MRWSQTVQLGFESLGKIGQQGDSSAQVNTANHFLANVDAAVLDGFVDQFLHSRIVQTPRFGVEKTLRNLKTTQFQGDISIENIFGFKYF